MSLNGQNVLVAGGTGLVGSNLIRRLVEKGAHVRATRHRREPVVLDKRIEYVQCDLTRGEDCRKAVEGMRYVFLCAANTSGAAVMAQKPLVHVTPNVLIDAQMLEAAYAAGVDKFLWLSSTTAYPPTGDRPVQEEEMFNGDPFEKYYFIGWAKRFTEIMCRMYGEKIAKPMTTIVLRPTNVYGVNDDFEFETAHVIPALIRKVVERWDPIEVWGTGEDVRDVIYVDDMVEAMLQAMVKIDMFTVANIGLGKSYSVKDILQTILEVDGYTDAEVVFDDSKPSMIPKRLVDISKAEELLDFRAKIDLREGIEKTVAWYRDANRV